MQFILFVNVMALKSPGVAVYDSCGFHNSKAAPPILRRRIDTGDQPSWLAVNTDQTILTAVIEKPVAGYFALLFDVRSIAEMVSGVKGWVMRLNVGLLD